MLEVALTDSSLASTEGGCNCQYLSLTQAGFGPNAFPNTWFSAMLVLEAKPQTSSIGENAMKPNTILRTILPAIAIVASITAATRGGVINNDDWIVFEDFVTGAECGIINAANAELVAFFDTGEMVIVSGPDAVLFDLIVTSEDEVLFQGTSSGFVEFLDDADGLPAVFWTTLVGTLVEVDTFTGEPFDSGLLPEDRFNTGCEACDFIDDSPLCDDIIDGGIGGNIPGDVLFPFPVLCGAGSPAMIVLAMLAVPITKRARRRT